MRKKKVKLELDVVIARSMLFKDIVGKPNGFLNIRFTVIKMKEPFQQSIALHLKHSSNDRYVVRTITAHSTNVPSFDSLRNRFVDH